jgi:integrator complex subunit 11
LFGVAKGFFFRKNNKIPVYFSAGLIEKVQFFYKLFVNWTNQKIKSTFLYNNMFDFKHIQSFDRNLIKSPFPMVLFATPGMLHGGTSLQVFSEWCSDEKNTIIIPGYCVAGTLGNKLLKGVKNVNIDKKCYEVKMKVKNMSFSAHADSKGILNLIKHVEPQNVCLVHGEKGKMEIFTEVVKETLKIPCYYPANFEDLWLEVVPEDKPFPISLDERILSLLETDRSVRYFFFNG